MKVAIFTDTFFPEINGVANTLSCMNEYLKKQGIETLFFAPEYGEETEDVDIVRIKGIQVSVYPQARVALPFYSYVKDVVREFKPDIIHVTTQLAIGRMGVKYAIDNDIPLAMSYHTNFDRILKSYKLSPLNPILWRYNRRFYNKSDLTLCPSQDTINILKRKGFRNLELWPHGVDMNCFNPKHYDEAKRTELGGAEKLLFTYVGRLSIEKDLDVYLESIKIVNEKIGTDKINFIFTGNGPYQETIESENIPNVILTGPKRGKDLWSTYASSDVFVFPSGFETFGMALAEAMSSGLPCITVNEGGVVNLATHGENAIVCQYRDPSSIADAIIELADNPMLRKTLGEGGLKTAKGCSWDTVFDKQIASYKRIIRKIKTKVI